MALTRISIGKMKKIQFMAAVAAFLISLGFGVLIEHWRMDAKIKGYKLEIKEYQLQASDKARKHEQAMQRASDEQAIALSKALEEAKAESKIITKKVIEYVEDPNTGKCKLNDDWVYAHNKAAGLPRDSQATGRANDGVKAVTDREALVAVTNNYAICHDRLIKLQGWQSWYQKVIDEN